MYKEGSETGALPSAIEVASKLGVLEKVAAFQHLFESILRHKVIFCTNIHDTTQNVNTIDDVRCEVSLSSSIICNIYVTSYNFDMIDKYLSCHPKYIECI